MTTEKPHLPQQYQTLRQRYPEVGAAAERLGAAVREAGPLDLKTGHLIQLAAAAAIRAEGAVHSHTRQALAAGATPEELRQSVLLLTSTIGFPTVVAALSWVEDELVQR